MKNTFACILAGGSGERFWPLSRKARPKHLIKLFAKQTLLEQTVRRLDGIVPIENIFILTNETQLEATRKAVPFILPSQIIAEPCKRDTAPAAALATALARRMNRQSTLALLPADALIKDSATFKDQLRLGLQHARKSGDFVTFSIQPSYPATGFGYLQIGEELAPGIFRVHKFVEKPNLDRAELYLASGRYGWNSGIFIWQVQSFLEEARTWQPPLADFIEKFPGAGEFQPYLQEAFPLLPKTSVDYAIMEQTTRVTAIKAAFDWDDVGTWTALPRHLGADSDGNTIKGRAHLLNSRGNIIFSSGRVVALCGVSDLVVVATKDAVLVCHKSNAQEVKNLLSTIPNKYI